MKRVALINPPSRAPVLRDYFCTSIPKAGYYWHPIDLLIPSGALAGNSDLVVVDAVAEGLEERQVMERIGDGPLSAAVVLAGAGNPADLEFAGRLKAEKGCQLIVSGEEAMGDPAGTFARHPFPDAVMLDFTSDSLARFIGGEKGEMPGLARRGGVGVPGRREAARGTFSIPVPEHTRFPLDAYRLPFAVPHPWASVLTNFGCPFRCAYCNSGTFGYKVRDPENFAEEIDVIGALGIRHVFVRDMTFAADREHGIEICRALSGRGLSWNCYCRIDRVDRELLGAMAAAGCVMVQFGVESAASDLRAGFGRGTGVERAQDAFAWSREAGIAAGAHFILGLPDESESDVRKTIAFARRLKPDYASFNVFAPRAGSKLAGEGAARAIPPERLETLRRRAVLSFYADPRYILGQVRNVRSAGQFLHLARSGFDLFRNAR